MFRQTKDQQDSFIQIVEVWQEFNFIYRYLYEIFGSKAYHHPLEGLVADQMRYNLESAQNLGESYDKM